MSLRTRPREVIEPKVTSDRMVAVTFTENGQIVAHWKVRRADGKDVDVREPVGEALATTIMGRAAVQTMLDNLENDTYTRALERAGMKP